MLKPLELGAMFPFLPEGRDAIKAYGVTLADLVKGRPFEPARGRAWRRIKDALEGKWSADFSIGGSDADLLEEVLAYLYARILVSAVNDPYLTKKYVIAEAKVFEKRLGRLAEDDSSKGRATGELSPAVGRLLEYLQLSFQEFDDQLVGIHFADYLRLASGLDQKDWALAIQDLRKGTVRLRRDQAFRLFEEAYRISLEGELPIPISETLYEEISADADKLAQKVGELRAHFEGTDGVLDEASFPPCIKHLLEMTGSGQNVPHMGRFTLVAFLHTIGYDKEGMIALFSRWPDFNVQKSMYQIQHITGETSATEYTPPTCATMKTYGICYNPDNLCKTIRHPLSYYRRKLRASGRIAERKEPPSFDEEEEARLAGD